MKFIEEEKYKDLFGIYSITNTVNGKQYIGQTKQNFQRRFWNHCWKLNDHSHDNRHLQNAWNKYGSDSFTFSVVQICSDSDDVDAAEIYYIKELKDKGSCYNISDGGGGKRGVPMNDHAKRIVGEKNREHMLGRKASEETKRKMSESSKHLPCSDEHKNKLRELMTGRVVSDCTREKISKALQGSKNKSAKISEDVAKGIKESLMNGENITAVSKKNNISYGIVLSIKNNRTWKHAHVDGWDEWCTSNNIS